MIFIDRNSEARVMTDLIAFKGGSQFDPPLAQKAVEGRQ